MGQPLWRRQEMEVQRAGATPSTPQKPQTRASPEHFFLLVLTGLGVFATVRSSTTRAPRHLQTSPPTPSRPFLRISRVPSRLQHASGTKEGGNEALASSPFQPDPPPESGTSAPRGGPTYLPLQTHSFTARRDHSTMMDATPPSLTRPLTCPPPPPPPPPYPYPHPSPHPNGSPPPNPNPPNNARGQRTSPCKCNPQS